MAQLSPPVFTDLSFSEKMLLEKLHKLLGNNWKTIARIFPRRSAVELKTYWYKKQQRERNLQATCRQISHRQNSSKQMAVDASCNNTRCFLRTDMSDLDVLALVSSLR